MKQHLTELQNLFRIWAVIYRLTSLTVELYSSKDLRIEYFSDKVKKGQPLSLKKGKPFIFLIGIKCPSLLLADAAQHTNTVLSEGNSSNLVYISGNTLSWDRPGLAELFIIQMTESFLGSLLKAERDIASQVKSLTNNNNGACIYWKEAVPASSTLKEQLFALLQVPEYRKTVVDLLVKARVHTVLAFIVNELSRPQDGIRIREKEKRFAEMARDYLDKLPARSDFTIISLAEQLDTNETTLKIAFKKLTGTTIHRYYHQKRMERAEMYLRDGKSITEVAKLVGYTHISHFSAMYKAEHGRPPTKVYRQ